MWFQPLLCSLPLWGAVASLVLQPGVNPLPAEAFQDAEQSVPEKAHFVPKGMKMLPLTPVRVPNIYKRVDLRCANSFWEVLELLTLIKTTSYDTCCAVSPTSHTPWVFLTRSETSLTRSRWFFVLPRVSQTFPQGTFSLFWKFLCIDMWNTCLTDNSTASLSTAMGSSIRPLEGMG